MGLTIPTPMPSTPNTADSTLYPAELSQGARKLLRWRWRPATPAQWRALNSDADILLYGGAAGGGKSEFLLVDAAAEFRNTNLRAILFRESFPQLRDLIRKSYRIYKRYPYFAKYNKTEHVWQFPTNAAELADIRNLERVAAYVNKQATTPDGQPALEPIYIDGACATVSFAFMENDDRTEDHQGQEYSWVGFDESTHHTEYQIRYMLTRMRSTDPRLRIRMRLATNPGGEGHTWHMKVFISEHGVCPHCYPRSNKCRKPFLIYKDARWFDGEPLSQVIDGKRIDYTTQFVPANLKEHSLFGEGNVRYKAQLRMQRPSVAKALEEGCWAVFEGQFFTCWEENRGVTIDEFGRVIVPKPDMRMTIPFADIPEIQYWYPHFTGTDYGFTHATASYLCARTPGDQWFPNGRIYVIDEYLETDKLAEDVAQECLERWFLDRAGAVWVVPQKARKIMAWYLSHDAYNETGVKTGPGVSLTRADQMNAKMQPYGMGYTRAANEREGGWQHIFRMLRSGELVICEDRCPRLIEAIPTRLRDPKKKDDIIKKPGDVLDDAVDGLRYAVYSWSKVGAFDKPIEIELAERVQNISDPTNVMITRLKLAEEIERRNTPIFVGRNAKAKQQQWTKGKRKPF